MRFLLHGTLTPAAAEAVRRHDHAVQRAADIGLSQTAGADEVLEAARQRQFDVITNDAALVEHPFSAGCRFNRCIVYLQLAGGELEQDDAIDRLFARYKRLSSGRLYTVTAKRVKVRQLPAPRDERSG